jgi:hypothetical protein
MRISLIAVALAGVLAAAAPNAVAGTPSVDPSTLQPPPPPERPAASTDAS